jgi:hypothetical protein
MFVEVLMLAIKQERPIHAIPLSRDAGAAADGNTPQ